MNNFDSDYLYSCAKKIADEFRRLEQKEEKTDKEYVDMVAYVLAIGFILSETENGSMPSMYGIEQCCCLKEAK